MNKMYKILGLVLLCAAFAVSANAQNTFYTQNFAGALPTGWSAGGWVWKDTLLPGQFKIGTIRSTTKTNGFALYDSDAICSGNQDAKLTSATINCTGKAAVVLEFQEWYRQYYDSTAVMVSRDNGTTWTYFAIPQNGGGNGNYCANAPSGYLTGNNPTTAIVDITSVAANQANVKIGFRFLSTTGQGPANLVGCAYQWMVDDIVLKDAVTIINNNTAIDITTRPESWALPASQVRPVIWEMLASNKGAQAQTNLKSTVTFRNSAGTALYTNVDDGLHGVGIITTGAAKDDTISFRHVPDYTPPATAGVYSYTYNLTQTATDQVLSDNTYTSNLVLTDSLFSKARYDFTNNEPRATGAQSPASSPAFEWGVFYDIPAATSPSYVAPMKALTIQYALARNAGTPWANDAVGITLYKWDDINANDQVDLDTELLEVGTGSDIIPSTYVNYDTRTVDLIDSNTGNPGGAVLSNGLYFAAISVPASTFLAVDEIITRNNYGGQLTQALNAGTWSGGFASGAIPSIALITSKPKLIVATNNVTTSFKSTVFPNPTDGTINLSITFGETIQNIAYDVIDARGVVVYNTQRKNLSEDLFAYDTKDLAAGTYSIKITTDKGVQTARFVVTK